MYEGENKDLKQSNFEQIDFTCIELINSLYFY